MRELGGELRGFVGLVVDVIRWSVKRDSGESGDGFNLPRDQVVSRGLLESLITLLVAVGAFEK